MRAVSKRRRDTDVSIGVDKKLKAQEAKMPVSCQMVLANRQWVSSILNYLPYRDVSAYGVTDKKASRVANEILEKLLEPIAAKLWVFDQELEIEVYKTADITIEFDRGNAGFIVEDKKRTHLLINSTDGSAYGLCLFSYEKKKDILFDEVAVRSTKPILKTKSEAQKLLAHHMRVRNRVFLVWFTSSMESYEPPGNQQAEDEMSQEEFLLVRMKEAHRTPIDSVFVHIGNSATLRLDVSCLRPYITGLDAQTNWDKLENRFVKRDDLLHQSEPPRATHDWAVMKAGVAFLARTRFHADENASGYFDPCANRWAILQSRFPLLAL